MYIYPYICIYMYFMVATVIVISAIMLLLKTQISSDMINILRNNLSIMRISHLLLYSFICKKHHMNAESHPDNQGYGGIHKVYTCAHLKHHHLSIPHIESHPSTILVLKISSWFQITLFLLFQNNSQATTLLTPISTSTCQVFFKVKCQIYCSIYVLFNHLTCTKLCYYFN